MAVIEIARIQVRRGQENITGIPVLSPGEFGWAEDTEHLYIGKSVSEGAVSNSNTRLLTENDLINLYNGSITSSTLYNLVGHIPNVSLANTVSRSLQSKLDDEVSVLSYGAIGDGTTPNAQYFRAAIESLYLNATVKGSLGNESLVTLYVPAGVYNIETTIYLPPNVIIVGDGLGKTILNLVTTSIPLMQYADQTSIHNNYVVFVDGQANILSATRPNKIIIKDMTLQYDTTLSGPSGTSTLPLLRADCGVDCLISGVQFLGNYVAGSGQIADNNYTGIDIRGQGSLITQDLIVENCSFDTLYYGIKSNYDMQDSIIINSRFRNLNRGVVYGESVAVNNFTGPLRSRIENNKFYYIEREGIFVGRNTNNLPTHHVSAFNIFNNVGNNTNNDQNQVTPVITFQSQGNTSISDYNSRYDTVNSTTTNYASTTTTVSGPTYVTSPGAYAGTIIVSSNPVLLSRFPYSSPTQSTIIDYNLNVSTTNRSGELTVGIDVYGIASITDSYSYSGPNDGGVVFTVNLNNSTNLVELYYTSPNYPGTITYRYTQLQ